VRVRSAADPRVRSITVRAFAKINLTLRVLGVQGDGYHLLRTVFQSLTLHDTLRFRTARGWFALTCNDPLCPVDRTNLVWRAAEALWRASGRAGEPEGVTARIVKRIPLQAGLGGGSSDAAAAIRALSALWGIDLPRERQHAIAAGLGADVPYFLQGGTALGLDRGDLLFPLADQPAAWVTLVIPAFGVSTRDAYGWFDETRAEAAIAGNVSRAARAGRDRPAWLSAMPAGEWRNDLEPAVVQRYPGVGRLGARLRRLGAFYAAMSGSGSTVFGLFGSRQAAAAAAAALAGGGRRTIVTRTLARLPFAQQSAPR
jgi:4-diphosphocytidyl-2-C-methyl-D-erythritol kinase